MRGRQPEAGCPFVCHSPHYCCPPPTARPHLRGCELGGNEGLRGYGVLKPFEDAGTWESVCREGGESLLSTARTPYTDEPSTAASETERERVSKRHTPSVRTLPSRPQPRPSCHYLPSCSTASRNLAHSPARYSALSPFPSLVSSIGSPTYSLSLFPNSL